MYFYSVWPLFAVYVEHQSTLQKMYMSYYSGAISSIHCCRVYSLNHFGGVAGEEVEYVFHRTHIGRLEEPQISHESVCFTRIGKIVGGSFSCADK